MTTLSKTIIGSTLLLLSYNALATMQQVDFQDCFTPGMDCTQLIVNTINQTSSSIDVQAYNFESLPIANALANAEARGVKVRVILDRTDLASDNKAVPILLASDIPVWIDGYKIRIAHNKVMVLDGKTVITGSFNFSASAQKSNAENVAILGNNTTIAQSYEANFENRLAVSRTYQSCKEQGGCASRKSKSKNNL